MGGQQLGMTQETEPSSLSIDNASPVPPAGVESTQMIPFGPTVQPIDPSIQISYN